MKKKYFLKSFSILLAVLVVLSVLVGCAQQPAAPESAPPAAEETAAAEPAEEPPAQPAEAEEPVAELVEDVPEELDQTTGRVITDMAGREVVLPAEINRAFTTDPVSGIYLYTLAPDKLLGWNYQLNELEAKYIPEPYASLPVVGMRDSVNYEAVIAAEPDVILAIVRINDKTIEEAEALSDSLGVPVVIADTDMNRTAEVYRFLGEVLNETERAEQLAAYVEQVVADVDALDVPEGEQPEVYLGNGENSLETAPQGSDHSQIIDMLKAKNVADVELGEGSRIQVSLEQIITWNPEYIIVNGEPKEDISGMDAARALVKDPDFMQVRAVQEEKVIGAPKTPFSWIDRPTGPNRFIGVLFLGNLFYPDHFDFNMTEKTQEFYSLFYHVDLSVEEAQELLNE